MELSFAEILYIYSIKIVKMLFGKESKNSYAIVLAYIHVFSIFAPSQFHTLHKR